MKDRALLLVTGAVCAFFAWASWRFMGEFTTGVLMTVLLVAYAVDNFQLRRQVRSLLAEREKRERREKEETLRRLMQGLVAARDKRAAE